MARSPPVGTSIPLDIVRLHLELNPNPWKTTVIAAHARRCVQPSPSGGGGGGGGAPTPSRNLDVARGQHSNPHAPSSHGQKAKTTSAKILFNPLLGLQPRTIS